MQSVMPDEPSSGLQLTLSLGLGLIYVHYSNNNDLYLCLASSTSVTALRMILRVYEMYGDVIRMRSVQTTD
jgi:hypothetical protein